MYRSLTLLLLAGSVVANSVDGNLAPAPQEVKRYRFPLTVNGKPLQWPVGTVTQKGYVDTPAAQVYLEAAEALSVLNRTDPDYEEKQKELLIVLKTNAPPGIAFEVELAQKRDAPVRGIVQRNGWQFTLNGMPWFCAGTNIYGIGMQLESWTLNDIQTTLVYHASKGANCIRIWAFGEGFGEYEGWYRPFPFQPQPGVYNNTNIERLDYVLSIAGQLGIRVTLVLSNSLKDFGGRLWYVRKLLGSSAREDDFYVAQQTRDAYKNWVRHLLTRRNTINNQLYRDDPVIFSIQLQNEPFVANGYDASRGLSVGSTLRAWVSEMAAWVKQFDTRHLISVGDQGFRIDGRADVPGGWANSGFQGGDYSAYMRDPNVDFGTVHYYTASYGIEPWNSTFWLQEMLADRAAVARSQGKPIVLEEIGGLTTEIPSRNGFFQAIFRAANFHGVAGIQTWQATPNRFLDDLSYSYETDGGAATLEQYNWANTRNQGDSAQIAFPAAPPCVDYTRPGTSGTCQSQLPGGQRDCNVFIAGYCRATCNQCQYYNTLRSRTPYQHLMAASRMRAIAPAPR